MLNLPQRPGERPMTNYGLPHEQLSQNTPADVYVKLKDQAFEFEFVERLQHSIRPLFHPSQWLFSKPGAGLGTDLDHLEQAFVETWGKNMRVNIRFRFYRSKK